MFQSFTVIRKGGGRDRERRNELLSASLTLHLGVFYGLVVTDHWLQH